MSDNVAVTPGTGAIVAADEATYSGDTSKIQLVRFVHVTGAEGSKTVSELVRLEDSAHASGDPGLPIFAVRKDTAAALAGTDADYIPLIVDATGRLWVHNETLGAVGDSAWTSGNGTLISLLKAVAGAALDTTTASPVTLNQLSGTTVLTGNGASGAGALRVTLASDSTGQVVALGNVGANSVTGDTGAKTATGNGTAMTNTANKGVQIFIDLGTVSGTSPTCTFKVQGSVDGGTNWFDIPGAATASLTSSVDVGIMVYPGVAVTAGSTTTGTTATANMALPRTWRVVWTVGGTTPSFTINSISYNYLA